MLLGVNFGYLDSRNVGIVLIILIWWWVGFYCDGGVDLVRVSVNLLKVVWKYYELRWDLLVVEVGCR